MAVPSTYGEVAAHLRQVQSDPSTRLDRTILDKLKLELTESTDRKVPAALLTQISQLLPVLQEDPTPLTTLGIKSAVYFSFADLRAIDPPIDFIAGFRAPSPPINELALTLLRKAGHHPSDAAIVAGDPELVTSLVELWLSASSTAVAQAAFDALWALLEVDHTSTLENGAEDGSGGQGLMWRRVFKDRDVYGRLFSFCSLTDNTSSGLSNREKTVAQGRLMSFLVRAGRLRWDYVSSSHIPEVETKYESKSLLHFAACEMVDKGDVLMHMTQLNFFRDLLELEAPNLTSRTVVQSAFTFSSPALDFLISHKIHDTLLEYYVDESKLDPVDLSLLCGPVMAYVAQYAELYPNHLLQNPQTLLDRILSRIDASFLISSSQWAHGPVPSGQLNVLSSLPRVLLLEASSRGVNPVVALPTNPPNQEVFNALGKIFHGPPKHAISDSMNLNTSGQTATDWNKEAATARVLYFLYQNHRPSLWEDVVAAADVLAMKDISLAAISFMLAIVTANWQTLSAELTSSVHGTSRYQLPSEEELGRLSPATQAISPPALTTLLPFLFKPPRSYSEFVAGGAADPQNVVWKVATAKYEIEDRGSDLEDIVRTLKKRVDDGPLGAGVQTIAQVETIMSRFGAKKGRKLPGSEFTWDGTDANGEADTAPTPLFPKYHIPRPRPLSAREQTQVDLYRTLRERFHDGPYYSILGVSAGVAGYTGSSKANFDPFNGMQSYSGKYQKKKRLVPKIQGRPYVMKFFPRELWTTIQPNYKPDGILDGYVPQTLRTGTKRGFEEDDEDEDASKRQRENGEEGEDLENGGILDDEEDQEGEEEIVDDDFEDDDDEMGGDYNAEQYFDGGDDEYGDDGFGDGGAGGGDEDTY
ncbi:DNA-directed RNA polymerase III subunit Rpc31-domain-containing protein [Aspergillus desertorum]